MDPALTAVLALVLLLLCWMASWTWLQVAKYPTKANQERAAMFTGWVFAFIGIIAAIRIFTL